MEITPVMPAARTAKVRTAKTSVPKSSNKKAAKPAVAKPVKLAKSESSAAPRKRKVPARQQMPLATDMDRSHMIATAAYYLAERRQFAPGQELQDWLTAERLILGNTTGN